MCLLLTFSDSLNQDQDRPKNVGPDLGTHCLKVRYSAPEIFLIKTFFVRKQAFKGLKINHTQGNFRHLLITFANSLVPDKDRRRS